MDLTKKIEMLSKEQRKILRGANINQSDYKADLQSQLLANPPPDQEKKFWIKNMLRVIDEEEKNPTKNYGCLVVIFIFIGLPLIFFIADEMEISDLYQRTVNPQKYWRKQVAILEQKIYETEASIKELYDYKPHKSFSVNYDALVRYQIIEGKEPEEAKKFASDMIKEIDAAKTNVHKEMGEFDRQWRKYSYKSLNNYKRELQQARNELSKYQ